MGHVFETVDVFTERRFGGNPLAVFTDGRGLGDAEMQSLAFEFNLSETTFVLPPANPANSARVRIFNRSVEMAFAGHPSIGAAYVLARNGHPHGDKLRLEVPAGIVVVEIERESGAVVGGKIMAPQPLSIGRTFPVPMIAECLGVKEQEIDTSAHEPVWTSVGNSYVMVRVRAEALSHCLPDIAAFRAARDAASSDGRFSIYAYAYDGENVRARMFAPLAGTWEDAATGSAATPLAGLLLHHKGGDTIAFDIRQGVEMRRPSLLRVTAHRKADGIRATVAGRCVPVLRGETQ